MLRFSVLQCWDELVYFSSYSTTPPWLHLHCLLGVFDTRNHISKLKMNKSVCSCNEKHTHPFTSLCSDCTKRNTFWRWMSFTVIHSSFAAFNVLSVSFLLQAKGIPVHHISTPILQWLFWKEKIKGICYPSLNNTPSSAIIQTNHKMSHLRHLYVHLEKTTHLNSSLSPCKWIHLDMSRLT